MSELNPFNANFNYQINHQSSNWWCSYLYEFSEICKELQLGGGLTYYEWFELVRMISKGEQFELSECMIECVIIDKNCTPYKSIQDFLNDSIGHGCYFLKCY